MKIWYLPHTADIRMKIEAATLEDLFTIGVEGMSNILIEGYCKKNLKLKLKRSIKIQSSDYTCLLIDFLSEVLSHSYTDKAIYCGVNSIFLSEYEINAEITGVPIEKFHEEIKAVTYHEAQVQKNRKDLWETLVIFDI